MAVLIFLIFLSVVNGILIHDAAKKEYQSAVVLWHGMGDSCCFPFSLGSIKKLIERELNSTVYVKSLEIGGSLIRDYESGYFIHPKKQVQDACDQVRIDPYLMNGFDAIGFSQGSQFFRALVQQCPEAKVRNLISLGGQHQGIYGLPNCPSLSIKSCEYLRELLNTVAYDGWVQRFLVQATYWHDPMDEDLYRSKSSFLSDINNEQTINQDYILRLQNLNKFVLVKFDNDSIVVPRESEWFGYYKPGSDEDIQTLEESEIFIKDKLGLKQMKEKGKLDFLVVEGNHLQFTTKWFIENIIDRYLRN